MAIPNLHGSRPEWCEGQPACFESVAAVAVEKEIRCAGGVGSGSAGSITATTADHFRGVQSTGSGPCFSETEHRHDIASRSADFSSPWSSGKPHSLVISGTQRTDRTVGLTQICQASGRIVSACSSRTWPGLASFSSVRD